jgi:hypothetical protein
MESHPPESGPSGAHAPPPQQPSTALAASAPLASPVMSRTPARLRGLRGLVDSALDRLDALADRIADVAGLR